MRAYRLRGYLLGRANEPSAAILMYQLDIQTRHEEATSCVHPLAQELPRQELYAFPKQGPEPKGLVRVGNYQGVKTDRLRAMFLTFFRLARKISNSTSKLLLFFILDASVQAVFTSLSSHKHQNPSQPQAVYPLILPLRSRNMGMFTYGTYKQRFALITGQRYEIGSSCLPQGWRFRSA